MLAPSDLIDRLVELLQQTPEVVRLLDNRPDWIQAYRDAPPESSSLSLAVFQMPAPGILIAWMDSSLNNNSLYEHNFSIYVRASDALYPGCPTFSELVSAIINARPVGQDLPLRNLELVPDVEPMSVPSIKRIHDEEGTVDLFEISTTITEKFDNFGESQFS